MARKDPFKAFTQASVASERVPAAKDEEAPPQRSSEDIVVDTSRETVLSSAPQTTMQGAGKQAVIKDEVKPLDPFSIRMSALQDRMDLEQNLEQTIDRLAASIQEHGQHVPILVRPKSGGPDKGGHYEIVYGRRRLLACQKINKQVLARVKDLDDEHALIAQGQENSARLDTSFIEQALFVHSIKQGGFDQRVLMEATGLDKTAVSRMNTIVSALTDDRFGDLDIIKRIGPSHGSGRRPWEHLSKLVKKTSPQKVSSAIHKLSADTSDERLQQAIEFLSPSSSPSQPEEYELEKGSYSVKISGRIATLTIKQNAKFAEFLMSKIEDLYSEWEGKK